MSWNFRHFFFRENCAKHLKHILLQAFLVLPLFLHACYIRFTYWVLFVHYLGLNSAKEKFDIIIFAHPESVNTLPYECFQLRQPEYGFLGSLYCKFILCSGFRTFWCWSEILSYGFRSRSYPGLSEVEMSRKTLFYVKKTYGSRQCIWTHVYLNF
jgi:hypothetical protein